MRFTIEGCVVQSDSWIHKVNLRTWICFCQHYQKNDIPCDHTMACIFALSQSLKVYLLLILSVTVWTATYIESMSVINVSNLHPVSDMKCNPSHTCVSCERPRKKQIWVKNIQAPRGLHQKNMRKNEGVIGQNAVHRCSTCHEVGHNASTCRRPHN